MARVRSSQSKVASPKLGRGICACSRREILLRSFGAPQFTIRNALAPSTRCGGLSASAATVPQAHPGCKYRVPQPHPGCQYRIPQPHLRSRSPGMPDDSAAFQESGGLHRAPRRTKTGPGHMNRTLQFMLPQGRSNDCAFRAFFRLGKESIRRDWLCRGAPLRLRSLRPAAAGSG